MSRRRVFGSLCSLIFLVNLARVVFAPLLEPLREAFGASAAAVGVLATLAWLGSALPRIPTGYVLTRVAREHVVLVSGTVLAVASAVAASATSITVLWAGASLMGLSSGIYFVAANPLVTELFPDRVGRMLGIHGMASQFAATGAPLLVGAVLAAGSLRVGAVLVAGSWRLVFWLIAAAALLATIGLFLAARATALPEAGVADRDLLGAARAQWRLILAGVVIIGATGFVWNGLFNFYVSYLTAAKGLAEPAARNLLTLTFAAGIPSFVVAGRLADSLPQVPLLLSIIGGFVLVVLALTAVTGVLALAVTSAVLGFVIHALFPTLDTYLLGSLPDEHRGSAYAVYSGSMMLVQAFGSAAIGTLVDAGLPYDTVFRGLVGALALVLVALVGLYLADRLPTGAATPEGV